MVKIKKLSIKTAKPKAMAKISIKKINLKIPKIIKSKSIKTAKMTNKFGQNIQIGGYRFPKQKF